MRFDPPFQQGVLLRRYKRFLADVRLDNGDEITIHCPNTGSMKNCLAPESPCWFSESDNAKRKYPNTWEIATTPEGDLAGVNTGLANKLVVEAIESGVIAELKDYQTLKTEVRYGEEKSRIDIFLSHDSRDDCYVEVKNVTLREDTDAIQGRGLFPDSVSARGTKHLRELALMVEQGHRAVLLFCVQHSGITQVSPAQDIDPLYASTLREVMAKGVEVYAYQAALSASEIVLQRSLPVVV
ncbi:MAG: DNA/RNA nuclease SfsA [Cellvibrionaceae bacterium]